MINIDDKYKRVFEHFGKENQTMKLGEETTELQVAINRLIEGLGTVEEAEQELADTINVAMQYILEYGGSGESVLNHCVTKMIRTERRIDSGYYDQKE